MSDYIQTTLANSPNFFDETISLLEQSFEYPSHQSFLTDFYPLVGPSNHNHCHLLIDKQKVIGHIGIRKRKLSYKGETLEVILLGGIAIHPNYRGQGIFSDFFKSIIEIYNKDAALMFLWSDLSSLYKKFNFYEAGGVIQTGRQTLLNESLSSDWIESNLKSISNDQFEDIKSLYNDRKDLHLIRDERYWSAIREVSSARLFYKVNSQEKILSYFILSKGHDLDGIIHEYNVENEKDFFKEIDCFKLWLPENFNKFYHKKEIHFGFFVNLTDITKLSSFIAKITNQRLLITGKESEKIYFTFDNNEFDLDEQLFTTSLFGPNPIKEFEDVFPGLMINGLDSI
jgi:GNAT superfamily N-acetyltransferase